MNVAKWSSILVGLLLSSIAQATVLDFQGGVTVPTSSPYAFSTNGYTINFIETPSSDQPIILGSGLSPHGSDSFALCGHCYATSSFDVYKDDGAAFDVVSMELGAYSNSSTDEYDYTVTGHYAGGGTVTEILTVTVIDGFRVLNFPATWKQLDRLSVSADNTGNTGFAASTYDNITLDTSVFSVSYQNVPVNSGGGGTNTDPKPVKFDNIIADGVEYTVSVHWGTPYNIVYASSGPIFEDIDSFFPSAESNAAANVLRLALYADGYASLPSLPNSALVMVPGTNAFGSLWGPAVRLDYDPLDINSETGYDIFTAYDYIGFVRFDPLPQDVTIDIMPGDENNVVYPYRVGKLPVVILSSATFDATQVDASTLQMGFATVTSYPAPYTSDVDGLHTWDTTVRFRVDKIGLECNDTELSLTGETYAGDTITGTAPIDATNCEAGPCHIY